jgi:Bacterial antitoxin of type II TA system, VapB
MKRTNLVLREGLLEEATRLSGEKTYSRAVERALEEYVRRAKARRILDLRGRCGGTGGPRRGDAGLDPRGYLGLDRRVPCPESPRPLGSRRLR